MARLTPTAPAPTLPTVDVAASRSLTADDHGLELRCSEGVALTVAAGLPAGFVCRISRTAPPSTTGRALLIGNAALLINGRAILLN